MTAYLARIELRSRWRSVLLLTVLVAVVTGTVLTAVAGASRTRTAFDRYIEVLRPVDVAVFSDDRAQLEAVAELPHVAAVDQIELAAIVPVEEPPDSFFPMIVSLGGLVPYEYFRYPVLDGRTPAPDEPLVVALGERTARRLGKGVGDTLPMVSYSPKSTLAFSGEGDLPPPDGPAVELEVVGLVREPGDITGRETDVAFTMLTPAFRERYPADEIGDLGLGALVALDDPSSLKAFTEAAGDLGVQVDPSIRPNERGTAAPTMVNLAMALRVFALVAGLAGVVAIAQAVSRSAAPGLADDAALEALGLSRYERLLRLLLPRTFAVIIGAATGVGLAVVASRWMPIGLARRAEPDPGVDVDGAVLGLGFAGAIVLGGAVTALVLLLLARSANRTVGARPSRLARSAATVGAPAPVVMGLTMAAAPRSPSTSAARAALAGTAVAVAGLIAAVFVASSTQRLVDTPRLYGWGWDANLAGADLSDLSEAAVDERSVLSDPDIVGVAEAVFDLEVTVDGNPAFATVLEDRKGHTSPVMVRGAAPTGRGEVALAGETLAATGKDIGDRVAVDLGEGPRDLRISGVTVLPVSQDGGSSSVGLLLRSEAATAIGFSGTCGEAACYRNLALTVREGVDHAAVLARHSDEESGVAAETPSLPGEVERLTAVEQLPWFLAGFLAVLAAVAIGHSAATAVRRCRRELAVLRVIGFTRKQVGAVVTTQIAAISVGGALLGAAFGVITGRLVWRAVVNSVPLPFSPASPFAEVLLVVLAVLLLAQLAAAVPRRSAASLHTADALRAE